VRLAVERSSAAGDQLAFAPNVSGARIPSGSAARELDEALEVPGEANVDVTKVAKVNAPDRTKFLFEVIVERQKKSLLEMGLSLPEAESVVRQLEYDLSVCVTAAEFPIDPPTTVSHSSCVIEAVKRVGSSEYVVAVRRTMVEQHLLDRVSDGAIRNLVSRGLARADAERIVRTFLRQFAACASGDVEAADAAPLFPSDGPCFLEAVQEAGLPIDSL
jgi:hypothetical protein